MRALTGAVIAVLTTVLVFFGFGLRATSNTDARQPALAQAAYMQPGADARMQPVTNGFAAVGAQVVPVSAPSQETVAWQAAPGAQQPVLVNCGAGTQTLVRPVWLNGQQVSQVECVPAAGSVVYPAGAQVRTVAASVPVYDAQMVQAPARTYRQAPRRVTQPRRSWQKTALIIGGSSAAGAGVGGLVGGKKGALIGAAIGGGASTIYEAVKRR